jgi:hypothetical protein
MKTRSSSGVNSKIDLEFDIDTLRITDCEQESDDAPRTQGATSNIASILKRSNNSNSEDSDEPAGKVRAEVGPARLKNFINDLNQKI